LWYNAGENQITQTREHRNMAMNDEITRIKDRIVGAVDVERLYLFGSYAYGEPNEDSDYDFYMVIPDGGMRPVDAVVEARLSLRGMKRKPVDILAGTAEIFGRRSNLQATIERTIAEKGVLIYER
jgi:predicted nucleotidyltransferase